MWHTIWLHVYTIWLHVYTIWLHVEYDLAVYFAIIGGKVSGGNKATH